MNRMGLIDRLGWSWLPVLLGVGMLAVSMAGAAADGGFLLATFRGEATPLTEQIHLGLSADGRNWDALNGGKPVLVSELGEKGVRDPFLLRAHDGTKVYLLATDLSVHRNRNWTRAVQAGSKAIVVWESENLVHWSEPRLIPVAPPDAGCTWAPEAIWDEDTGDYLVFWASTTGRDKFAKQRIWAARTKDFRSFGEPFIYVDKPWHVIDLDIVRDGDTYYRFAKDEQFKTITLESSKKLMGTWEPVPRFSLAKLPGVEGPCCFLLQPAVEGKPAVWCLLLDLYSQGKGYQPYLCDDLGAGQFTPAPGFRFPYPFRHGSVLAITAAERERLQAAQAPAGASAKPASGAALSLRVEKPGKPISRELFGIFFEDLNYAADGGLYAELVQNRSFEYSAADRPEWHALTAWELVQRGGGQGTLVVDRTLPLNDRNPHYAVLGVEQPGEGVGMLNTGFDGIPVIAGDKYDFSLFAKVISGAPAPLVVRLESKAGAVLGETAVTGLASDWRSYRAVIEARAGDGDGRLVLLAKGPGFLGLDVVSLFPQKTFRNRPNGLRADLAQAIADLQPKFVRFPGGCLAHGDGLANMYRWKDTVGPVEQRREQSNIWRYHQSVGLGYFEYFQFCEDIGAQPLPVVPAAVCCQNSGRAPRESGQKGLPLAEMPAYVQEVLDLVEYANGPATSTWGAKRAAAGHPEPFHLKYLGVGNEDVISPVFRERFQMIHAALREKHPEITVVGTAGPRPDGRDFDEGWKFARELRLAMIDEHCYQTIDWFWDHPHRYDSYDRAGTQVYVGEYAAHDTKRRNTLRSALAEAAYLTSLEANGDVVRLASYAPLLAKQGRTQWHPDLIYFDNHTLTPSLNYYVQQLFSRNAGDVWLPIQFRDETAGDGRRLVAASCVQDSSSGDVILKLVSRADAALPVTLDLAALGPLPTSAACSVLAGDPLAENLSGRPPAVLPQTTTLAVAAPLTCVLPANSLTVIRIKGQ